ncbi:MAG: hypothetical protein HY291_23295 [Planctomycetes bacterium]|nr:hypothetical protein [Planctomycetota bacterium]
MAVAASSAVRCKRCATILRNRTVCPSCGMDISAAPASGSGAAKAVVGASGSGTAKAVSGASASGSARAVGPASASGSAKGVASRNPGKMGMKMCPVCFSSVAETSLVEHNGQMVCPECLKNLAKPE